ncbi:hypothetical protein ACIQAC_00675 [Streptomyces sp. NPDC088387]|uniref:hypothetical protein n=1 Tax=Streptomyces sp. NPDC088387 TaxID=3365859 RepID=UPI003808AFB0
MTLVLISPSYGSTETRRHWADTVDRPVAFTEPRYDELVTRDQRARLEALHPEGHARFWGATPAHDKKFADVGTGDVVLFTGQNQVRAIGEVGAIFRNGAFADRLWPPQPGGPSWHTVYSLLDVFPANFTYTELNSSIGYSPAFNFPGQLVLRGEKARSVLEDFMITPGTEWESAMAPLSRDRVAEERAAIRVAAAEELRTLRTGYRRTGRMIVVDRREAGLVREYREFLRGSGRSAHRFFCPSGVSDLYVHGADGAEVIEAKSTAEHAHVRQALGQLLDYAPYSPQPAHRLAGLFPRAPLPQDINLLHRYGVDCIHREGPAQFRRLPAPEPRRALMSSVWSDSEA